MLEDTTVLEANSGAVVFSNEQRAQASASVATIQHLSSVQTLSNTQERSSTKAAKAAVAKLGKLQSKKSVSAEKVLQAFNTWAFKREQPDNLPAMLHVIADSIALGAPIPFVLYWGKGPRSHADQPDFECLDYLSGLTRRIRDIYEPGAAIKLIFTDTHAELNGHSPQSMKQYFNEVASSAGERGFDGCMLGDLTKATEAANSNFVIDEDVVSGETLEQLQTCAAKWYRGEGSAKDGALKYYQMNMVEKRAVEHAFPNSIFITFNGSEFRGLFPKSLPIFYMYSLRKGVSIKPWFLFAAAKATA